MRWLHENMRRLRPKLWQEQTWLLHHDNAPSHTFVLTQQFLAKQHRNACYPPPTVLPWFGTLWLLPISKNETETERTPVWYYWVDPGRIADSAWHSDRKGLPESVLKMEATVGPVSTCGRELLRERWPPIGLMVSFMIFTTLVRNILDKPSYVVYKRYLW
jgi:hypothetical protein